MSQHPSHDPAGSSSGQQQRNRDGKKAPPFFGNYNHQDPTFLVFEWPFTTSHDDPTSCWLGGWPSQSGVQTQPTADTSLTYPNQDRSSMVVSGTGMGSLIDETTSSNSIWPTGGVSQAAHQSSAQSDLKFGDIHPSGAGAGMGTGQIEGDGQNPHFHHEQEGQLDCPSNNGTAGEGLPTEPSDVGDQHDDKASRFEEEVDATEQDTQGHQTGAINVGLISIIPRSGPRLWSCVKCGQNYKLTKWPIKHLRWKCGICDAAYGCDVHVRRHFQVEHPSQMQVLVNMNVTKVRFACRWCIAKSFAGSRGLSVHKTKHHYVDDAVRSDAPCVCPEEGCTEIQDPLPRDTVWMHMISRHDCVHFDCDPLWVPEVPDRMGYRCPFTGCTTRVHPLEELRRHVKSHESRKAFTQGAQVAPVSQPEDSDRLRNGEEDERLVSDSDGANNGPEDEPEQHPSRELQHQEIESVPLSESSNAGTNQAGTQAQESTLEGGQAQPQKQTPVNPTSTEFRCPACGVVFSSNVLRSEHIAWLCSASPRTERRNSPVGRHLDWWHEGKGPVV
ncbi:hypothetical protein B0T13DRAFT_491745 [Neurospora crassa]|nr:hypothetical protein B0T13DRAFT_491745 [Neurospora crassa]